MKTLIIYATKFGSVAECAELIAQKLPTHNITIANIARKPVQLPDDYDTVIIGCSIHVGKIQRSIQSYIQTNEQILNRKKCGLFICSLDSANNVRETMKKVLLEGFMKQTNVAFPGGKVTFSKMNFIYRSMMKKITGRSEDFSTIDDQKLDEFVAPLK